MKLKNSRVVVTGGAGFVGSHLVDRLLSANNEVLVIDDFSSGSLKNLAQHNNDDRLHVEAADIGDESAMMTLIKGANCVFHLACQNIRLSLHQPTLVHEVNATGTLNILKASAAARVERFLYCASSEVIGSAFSVPIPEDYFFCPETLYGASKLAGEYYTQVFHRSGWLNTVIARPYNNYGPREHYERETGEVIPIFILRALAGKAPIIYGDGKQTRDFVYVTETTDLLVKLVESVKTEGGTFNICRGEEISILRIAQLVCDLIGINTEPLHFPQRPSDLLRLCGDPSRLKKVLGVAPRISIGEGLKFTIDWFRHNVPITEGVLESIEPENWKTLEPEPWLKALS
jgi:UDP-glucose 4-epimerase